MAWGCRAVDRLRADFRARCGRTDDEEPSQYQNGGNHGGHHAPGLRGQLSVFHLVLLWSWTEASSRIGSPFRPRSPPYRRICKIRPGGMTSDKRHSRSTNEEAEGNMRRPRVPMVRAPEHVSRTGYQLADQPSDVGHSKVPQRPSPHIARSGALGNPMEANSMAAALVPSSISTLDPSIMPVGKSIASGSFMGLP